MAKFKSGDRVVYLDNSYRFSCGYVQHGQTYTVGCMLSEHLVQLKEFGDFTFGKGSFRAALSSEAVAPKPHKHAAVIKAWADGAEIEVEIRGEWVYVRTPTWNVNSKYRVKPEPKPDSRVPLRLKKYDEGCVISNTASDNNFVATFDGETGKLKAVEMI